ncbi:MAG: hypothetical protein JRI71_16540 [Deltaproteobacteria bacterium]|nr:hypothetical protein [Deltaproteobacteria bacterium]
MKRKAAFEPGDLVRSFTGHFGLVLSTKTLENIRGKARQGRKPGHFFAPGCAEKIDYLIQVPVFFEDGTFDIMRSMNIKAVPQDLEERRAKLEEMLRNM